MVPGSGEGPVAGLTYPHKMGSGKAGRDRKFKELTGAVNASFRDSRACGRGAVPPSKEYARMPFSRPAGPVLAPFCLVLLSAVIDPEKAVEAFAWRLLARRLAKPF